MDGSQGSRMSDGEHADADKLSAPRSRVIYEVVRRQGSEELERPAGSLFWSGLAAGITIMASVIAEGALHAKLPPGLPGRDLIADAGYTLGFVMVVVGRMQLFTEQTIVTVLPVIAEPGWRKLWPAARLWGIVLVANLLGTALAAVMMTYAHLSSAELLASMMEVSGALLRKDALELFLQAIPAGFLMASVAWLRAGSSGGELGIVLLLTYVIAIGEFTHVVAGSAETFLLVFGGQTGIGHALGGIIGPALAGNVIGGTGLFALLAHAQVRQEM